MTKSKPSISVIIYGALIALFGVLIVLDQGPYSESTLGRTFILTLIGLSLCPALVVGLKGFYKKLRKQSLHSLKPVVYIALPIALALGGAGLFLFAWTAKISFC